MLVFVVALSLFAGCGKKKGDSPDEMVTLKWVFGGPGKLEDSEKVWAYFNERLQDYLPNTKVEFQCIPHADYAEKWRLMAASGEKVDIAWVSYAMDFVEEAGKGAYMDITDLIQEYGQDMLAEFPDWLLDLTTLDGKIYAIPNYQMMLNPNGFSVEKHHIDNGWFDKEKAEEVLCSDKVWKKEDFKVFEDYFLTMLKQDEKVKYVSKSFLDRTVKYIGTPVNGYETIICNAVMDWDGKDYKVKNLITDYPEKYEAYDLMYDWYKKGIIRSDILENPSEKEGEYLLFWTSLLDGAKERVEAKRQIPMEIVQKRNNYRIGYKGSDTNTAIPVTSEHPERAMQLLNLINSSKGAELLNILAYGIEGEHYEKINDTQIKWLGDEPIGSSNNKYGYENWALGNVFNSYITDENPANWNDVQREVNEKGKPSKLMGFTLNQKPIKLEIAQYNAVMKEYAYLESGIVENYKELLKERNKKLVEAGSEKIVAEVQRQVDEWVKSKK